MNISNTQLVLCVVIILVLLFIFSGCKSNEGFYDQARESHSTPFIADTCGGDENCQIMDDRYPSGYHKSMPLSDRDASSTEPRRYRHADGGCPECTTGPSFFT